MMKVFISQPMRDKTNEQIKSERKRAVQIIKEKYGEINVEILDTFFENAPAKAYPLWYLGKSIQFLGQADVAYFIGDWKQYRGCRTENFIAKEYNIPTIEE